MGQISHCIKINNAKWILLLMTENYVEQLIVSDR